MFCVWGFWSCCHRQFDGGRKGVTFVHPFAVTDELFAATDRSDDPHVVVDVFDRELPDGESGLVFGPDPAKSQCPMSFVLEHIRHVRAVIDLDFFVVKPHSIGCDFESCFGSHRVSPRDFELKHSRSSAVI